MFKMTIQEGLKDCGPSCLSMIIKHYKGYVDIERLKEMCKTDKTGTTAYHLIEAAKRIGFEAFGIKCDLDSFNENIIFPCIAHVIINNSYKHYVVIEKVDYKKKRLLIKDPIGKIKYYSFEDFNKIFNNIIIILYPNKKIEYTPNNSLLKFISVILKSSTIQITQLLIISIFVTLFSIISTFYMQNMIDNVIFSKSKIVFIFILFLTVYILKITSDFFRNKLIILINQKTDLNLTYETFKQIINLPYCYYTNHTTGEIISRINDLNYVRDVISKVAISVVIDFPLTIIALVIMYIISAKLFVIALIILFLYLLVIIGFRNKTNEYIDVCTSNKADVTSYMVETINGFETIKGTNNENGILNKFENKYSNMSNKLFNFDNFYNYQYLLKEIINNIGFLIIILVGTFLVIDNELTIGKLLSFNALLVYFLGPIRSFIDLDSSIKHSKIAIKRILNLFYKENEIDINSSSSGDILFKNLDYSFSDVNYALKDINLKIDKKSKVMIIGKSGSGKSTLFKILKKYYKVPRDKVYINNIDINDCGTSNITYVSQNEILFTDTIYNNINSSNIINISKICLVDEIIKNNNLGFHTLIEENGFNISGGEKQRIILSRALATNFDILIIDEGLNQVDVNMERKILKNVFKEYADKTIIFISHRIDNMDLFDRCIKIEEGKITDDIRKN